MRLHQKGEVNDMKVLFVTNLPSPYRVDFFSELGKKCNLTVVYERKKANDRDDRWTGKSQKTYKEIFLKSIPVGKDNSLSLNLFQYLKGDWDIVVFGMYSTFTAMIAIIWMRLCHKKFFISTDGGFIKKESKIKFMLKKGIISSASAWLAPGENARGYLCYYGALNKKIYPYPFTSLFYSEIREKPLSEEEKREAKKNIGIGDSLLILYVGRFISSKGLDALYNALSYIHNEHFFLYVVGGSKEQFIQCIDESDKEMPSNIMVVPFMEKKDLIKYYDAADIFVLPTKGDVWGLVVNEAMARGLPVITTYQCGAGLELIESGVNGYLVESNEAKSIADKINEMQQEKISEMSQNCLNIISNYTIEKMVESHIYAFTHFLQS